MTAHDELRNDVAEVTRRCVFCGRCIAAARMFDAAAGVCWRCHLKGVPT